MSLTIEQAIAQVECLVERGKIMGPVNDQSKQALAEQFVADSLEFDKTLALSHVEQARRTQIELAAAHRIIERARERIVALMDDVDDLSLLPNAKEGLGEVFAILATVREGSTNV